MEAEPPASSEAAPARGKLIYNRGLPLALLVVLFVLLVERLLIHEARLGPEETMRRQLQALRDESYAEAFRFAAAAHQQRLDVAGFRSMVQQQFPEFVKFRNFTVENKRIGDRQSSFEVAVTSAEGETMRARYFVILEEGTWRVSGVDRLTPLRRRPGDAVTT